MSFRPACRKHCGARRRPSETGSGDPGLFEVRMLVVRHFRRCSGVVVRPVFCAGLCVFATLDACAPRRRAAPTELTAPQTPSATAPGTAAAVVPSASSKPVLEGPPPPSEKPEAQHVASEREHVAPRAAADACRRRCTERAKDCNAAQMACPPGAPCIHRDCEGEHLGCDAACTGVRVAPRQEASAHPELRLP
jgi:hypothetical protein